MRERNVEAHLWARVREAGGDYRKLAWIGRQDAPDDFVMFPYHAKRRRPAQQLLVEVKRPGEVPHASQLREHDRLRAMGVRVEVVDSIEAVDKLMLEFE